MLPKVKVEFRHLFSLQKRFNLCSYHNINANIVVFLYIMAQLFILSYSDAVSFRDIRDHLGTIPSIVTFYILYALVVEGDYSRVTRRNPGE